MALSHKPVVFRNGRGDLVTNDPILKAHQMLGEDISEYLAEAEAGVEMGTSTPDDEDIDTDPYNDLTGPELKQLALERGVAIKGLRKVGEVRQALRDADEAAEAKDEDDEEED